ncbi:ABC transporter permease [Coraliomargarita parva]|uniref:ABC transporter permease n=1 Tax=Coraliomargarita parva TaxID=3014050 RepID=UPI0022B5A880|nr:ABC transporter permease [Coraliomargarita parva]
MNRIALKMLMGDSAKYIGLLLGITFTSFLVTFAVAYFSGMMTRSFALISENPEVDVWVMDPAVRSVDHPFNLPDSALDRVKNVPGVVSATPMIIGTIDARFPNGRFQSVQVIGVDDADLTGLPPLEEGIDRNHLRLSGACVADDGGTIGKLGTPIEAADQWPHDGPHLDAALRPLGAGDELTVDDTLVRIMGRSNALPRFPPRPLLFTTNSTARQILPPERRRISYVLIQASEGTSAANLATQIASETGLRARSSSDFKADTLLWTLEHSEDVGDAVTMLTIAMLVGFGVTGVMMFMFTTENLKYYAVLNAMGATRSVLLRMLAVQTSVCAALGTGVGLGLCIIAGSFFQANTFPFLFLWFAPLVGILAVILVCAVAALLSMRPVFKMEPATILTGY